MLSDVTGKSFKLTKEP